MSQALVPGVPADVSLTSNCNLLTWADTPQTLVIWESDGPVNLVTEDIADGAALPSIAFRPLGTISAGSYVEIDVSFYGRVLLQSATGSTCKAEIR